MTMKDLEIDETTGAVVYGGRIVGEFDGELLTLNAGWCRLAQLGIKVEGDSTDRRKVLLDRSDGGVAPEKPAKPAKERDPRQEEIPMPDEPDTDDDPWMPVREPAQADF